MVEEEGGDSRSLFRWSGGKDILAASTSRSSQHIQWWIPNIPLVVYLNGFSPSQYFRCPGRRSSVSIYLSTSLPPSPPLRILTLVFDHYIEDSWLDNGCQPSCDHYLLIQLCGIVHAGRDQLRYRSWITWRQEQGSVDFFGEGGGGGEGAGRHPPPKTTNQLTNQANLTI